MRDHLSIGTISFVEHSQTKMLQAIIFLAQPFVPYLAFWANVSLKWLTDAIFIEWTIMDYHKLSQTITNYHGLSWTILDNHGLSWTNIDYNRLYWWTLLDVKSLLRLKSFTKRKDYVILPWFSSKCKCFFNGWSCGSIIKKITYFLVSLAILQ